MSKASRRQSANVPTANPTGDRPGAAPRSSSPSGSVRAGRRERIRPTSDRSFMERNRTAIVTVAALAGVVLISAFVFLSASSPAYACTNPDWTPTPTASPSTGGSPDPGYVQPDMGRRHANLGDKITYTYCPPASGAHYNVSGGGPVQPRFYGPNDKVLPEGWIHNLEHGALVVLYRGRDGDPGLTTDGQSALRDLFDSVPASPICGVAPRTSVGPIVARFDEMATPYAAIVWGRVLPLQELDAQQVLDFFQAWGERTNPEKQCAAPSAAPGTSPAASPGTSAGPSPS